MIIGFITFPDLVSRAGMAESARNACAIPRFTIFVSFLVMMRYPVLEAICGDLWTFPFRMHRYGSIPAPSQPARFLHIRLIYDPVDIRLRPHFRYRRLLESRGQQHP